MVDALGEAQILPSMNHENGQLEEALQGLYDVFAARFSGVLGSDDLKELGACDIAKVVRLLKHLVAKVLVNVGTQAFLRIVQVPLSLMRLELDLDQAPDHALDVIGVRDTVSLEIAGTERRVALLRPLVIDGLGTLWCRFLYKDII